MVVAFGVLLTAYTIKHPHIVKKVIVHPPWRVLLAGLFLSCNYYGYMKGLALTSASNAQIMIQLGPLTLLFLGVSYFKEPMRWIQWLGVLLAGVGFVFFNWDQIRVSLEHQDIYIAGNLWLLFAAITWATFASLQKMQLKVGWTPQMVNFLVYGVCTVALFPLANLKELAPMDPWQWFVLLVLGLNTVIAYGAFGEAMHRIPASVVSLIITLNPLLTILLVGLIATFGLTFISPEPIEWRGYMGAFFVVSGVAIAVSLRPKVRKQ